mmetsp:Transcript_23437/g.76178  ORF Transcript_23437/g.76178 Transcript_23437/m.76178 type:complete len:319 (-) Transcript_23437:413-1369(-)
MDVIPGPSQLRSNAVIRMCHVRDEQPFHRVQLDLGGLDVSLIRVGIALSSSHRLRTLRVFQAKKRACVHHSLTFPRHLRLLLRATPPHRSYRPSLGRFCCILLQLIQSLAKGRQLQPWERPPTCQVYKLSVFLLNLMSVSAVTGQDHIVSLRDTEKSIVVDGLGYLNDTKADVVITSDSSELFDGNKIALDPRIFFFPLLLVLVRVPQEVQETALLHEVWPFVLVPVLKRTREQSPLHRVDPAADLEPQVRSELSLIELSEVADGRCLKQRIEEVLGEGRVAGAPHADESVDVEMVDRDFLVAGEDLMPLLHSTEHHG